MENLDIPGIIEDFRSDFNSGNLKKDSLHNSFPKFQGEIQQADDDAFDRYRHTSIYNYIVELA